LIPEWTTSNVVEWMTSVNLHRYVDTFKSQGINGSDLLELNTEKLEVKVLLQIKILWLSVVVASMVPELKKLCF
jgi:hypothetical protein